MNDTADAITAQDTSIWQCGRRRRLRLGVLRRREAQSTVRTMPIVVVHEVGNDAFEMLLIQNEEPVETLVPDGSDESFRDPIRLRLFFAKKESAVD